MLNLSRETTEKLLGILQYMSDQFTNKRIGNEEVETFGLGVEQDKDFLEEEDIDEVLEIIAEYYWEKHRGKRYEK